jgi:hypothetical protein
MGEMEDYLEYYYYDYNIRRRRLLICIAICVCMLWYKLQEHRLMRRPKYGFLLERDLERERRLNCLYNGTEANCISELHMRKVVFHRLCGLLRSLTGI